METIFGGCHRSPVQKSNLIISRFHKFSKFQHQVFGGERTKFKTTLLRSAHFSSFFMKPFFCRLPQAISHWKLIKICSNHPLNHKRALVKSLVDRAKNLCSASELHQDFNNIIIIILFKTKNTRRLHSQLKTYKTVVTLSHKSSQEANE